ncbi:MAG: DcaP family trimeric outer membrane transporter, partial [Porticoccaceae bacterium]
MKTIKSLLAASVATAILAPSVAMAGGNDNDARIAALEAQIAELKAMMSGQIQEQQVLATRVDTVSKSAKSGPGYDVKIGGYIKADLTWTKASNGDPNNVGFYFPTQIPVGADGSGEGAHADMTVAESRINFSATRELDGHSLTFFTEMDFYGGGGNEIATNSLHPRLRHAFIKYDNWLIGQTWSTFQDVSALAENLDFIGPAEGTTFVRQPMVRYTSGGLQVAIENTNTRVNTGSANVLSDDGAIPDIIAKYTFKGDYGHVAVAGIYRDLSWETADDDYSDTGFGVSVSGKLKVGDSGDDF